MIACRTQTFAQSADEILLAPASDAGFGVGSDIGCIEGAERRRQRMTAGEWFAAMLFVGMAAKTTGCAIHIFTLLEECIVLRGRTSRRGKNQPRQQHEAH